MTGHAANDIPADFKSTLPPRKRAKTQEEKEQRRIERILRNRKAAHQSREKKRLHLMYLEKKCTLLERIISKLDLNKITETMTDPTLTKAVSEYEAFVKEGSGSSSGLDMSEQELGKSGKNSSESSMFSANSALSAATTPSVKSPSMSGTTPGSPCTTVGSDSGGYERQSLSVLEDAGSVSKTEPLFSSDSYSYGGTTYHPSYGMPDESDPRALSSTRTSNNESWNLLLTQSHDNYPVGDGNSYRDDVIEALEMTDSSVELDHWRNPAEVVQWEGEN